MPADVYQAAEPNPGLTPLPSGTAPTATAQALGGLGSEMDSLSFRLARARDATEELNAKAALLQAHSTLEQQYTKDPDWQNAPKDYADGVTQATGSILDAAKSKMSPQAYANVAFENTRWSIAGNNAVQNAALAKQGSQNTANLQASLPALNNAYLAAPTDTARAAIESSVDGLFAPMVQGGWMSAAAAQSQAQTIKQNLQEAHASQIMAADPQTAKAALAPDSGMFPLIPPERRVALLANADASVNSTATLKMGLLAQQSPAAAAAALGTIGPEVDRAPLFHAVIGQESAGNPNVPDSAKGAIGLTQLEPDTARASATRLAGMPGVDPAHKADLEALAGLPEDQLRARLRADGPLNKELGFGEFNRLMANYDNFFPATLAGYNAGQDAADKWVAAAHAKFGDDPTPAQFLSVVSYPETRNYIASVYAKLHAPLDAFGLSGQNASLRAQSMVAGQAQQEAARQQQTLNAMASFSRVNDPVGQFFPNGNNVNPQAAQQYREGQLAAALNGDASAAQAVRNFDMAQRNAPVMAAAYQMEPAQLEGAIGALQQRIDNAPDVTPVEREQLATLKTVQASVNAGKTTNPIGLAETQGLFKPVSVQAQEIGAPDFGVALDARNVQAPAAAATYGGALAPLKPEEAADLKSAYAKAPPSQKAEIAATLAAHLTNPDVFAAAMKQIAGDDRLAQVAGQLAGQNPALGQKILAGAEMIADKGVENKVQPVREAITAALPVGLYPNVQTQSDVAKAALAVYAANQGASAKLIDPNDSSGLKAAIEEVTGPHITLNGRVTPVPAGFSAGAVSSFLSSLNAADLKPFGGLQPGVDPAWLGAHAQLMPLALGGAAYQVLVGGKRVSDATGSPLQIDLRQALAAQTARLKQGRDRAAVGQNALDQADAAHMSGYGGGL